MSTGEANCPHSEDREIVDLGPIRLERVDRVLYMGSNLDTESHAELMNRWRDYRPEFKKSIDDKIGRLITLLVTNNPLWILSHIGACPINPLPAELAKQ